MVVMAFGWWIKPKKKALLAEGLQSNDLVWTDCDLYRSAQQSL